MVEHNRIKDSVFEIIKRYSSEDQPIDQNEIIKYLQDDSRNECDRKTVSRALEKLREEFGRDEDGDWKVESVKLHFEVVSRSSSPIYKRYWLEINDDGAFSDEELLFLMDAVQFSKHVDQKFAEEIARKLTYLSGNKYSKVFELHKKVNEKHYPVRKDFFLTLGDINTAIEAEKMISFYVNEYGVDKKLHRVGEPVKVCPYRIAVSDGNYYLLCGLKRSSVVRSYRIDKITEVSILDEDFPHTTAKTQAKMHPSEYIIEHPYMNSGEAVDVTIMIDRAILGDVIDAFGTKIKIDPADNAANRLTIHLKIGERDIVEWALRYGQFAVIIEPEYLKNEVRNLAGIIASAYRDRDQDIIYLERIERARSVGRLMLRNIDLNGKDSYKELRDLRSLSLSHNGIKDFSFLSSFDALIRLAISYNEIEDPRVLSGLKNLKTLNLEMTGITNLDFLAGLDNLTYLTIREHSLENAEGVYSLPNLTRLVVNKPVSKLIDRKKLKQVYGDKVEYIVADGQGLSYMQSLPPAENADLKMNEELMKGYVTLEVTDTAVREKLCSQIYFGSDGMRMSDKEFELLDGACDGAERLKMFTDPKRYVNAKYAWYVTVDADSAKKPEFDIENVSAISIFKQDHGLKLIAMAGRNHRLIRNTPVEDPFEMHFVGMASHIRHILDDEICWAELSGLIEREFRLNSTINDVINPAVLVNRKVFKELDIDGDDYHYCRKTAEGKTVKKIAYGHIM